MHLPILCSLYSILVLVFLGLQCQSPLLPVIFDFRLHNLLELFNSLLRISPLLVLLITASLQVLALGINGIKGFFEICVLAEVRLDKLIRQHPVVVAHCQGAAVQ